MLQNEVYSGEGRKNGKRIRRVSRAGSCFTFIRLKRFTRINLLAVAWYFKTNIF